MEHNYYDTRDYGCENFDLEGDFLQFLNEARNGNTGGIRSVSSPKVEISAERVPIQDKKSKKSWRRRLFSWLKVEKKRNDQSVQAGNKNRSHVPKKGHVSGPISGGSGRRDFDGPLLRRINSASLVGLFSLHKRVENEVHYRWFETGRICGNQGLLPHMNEPLFVPAINYINACLTDPQTYILEPLEDNPAVFGCSYYLAYPGCC